MKVKELIKKIEALLSLTSITSIRPYIDKKVVLGLISQLDEPEKVVIPQFVADWYEKHKDDFETSLFQCIYEIFGKRNDSELNEFENWVIDENIKPFQTLVNMHQFGYEVEKEKRYKVVMLNIASSGGVLTRIKHDDSWIWIDTLGAIVEGRTHTHKELEEAGFSWVFDCPGIEIEEVEG